MAIDDGNIFYSFMDYLILRFLMGFMIMQKQLIALMFFLNY